MRSCGAAGCNFNPRSREGSDPSPSQEYPQEIISIHAPAKGATYLHRCPRGQLHISIHAPAKGATLHRHPAGQRHKNFNPRSREGSDVDGFGDGKAAGNFNPRSREGSDVSRSDLSGADHHFNPRSREGSDLSFTVSPPSPIISIHAPAKGATCVQTHDSIFAQISIHAPAKGATDKIWRCYSDAVISIHAPAKGATVFGTTHPPSFFPFQSTLPRRERRTLATIRLRLWNFNPRSREGSDFRLRLFLCLHSVFQSTLPRRERPKSYTS